MLVVISYTFPILYLHSLFILTLIQLYSYLHTLIFCMSGFFFSSFNHLTHELFLPDFSHVPHQQTYFRGLHLSLITVLMR